MRRPGQQQLPDRPRQRRRSQPRAAAQNRGVRQERTGAAKVQLAHEIEDHQKAGYDKELIRQYTAQRMYEIDKSMLEKNWRPDQHGSAYRDGAKSLMDGLQQEWTGFFTKVFDTA